jgi:FkbM family methyltransferase
MKSFDIEGISQDDHLFKRIVETQSFYEKDLLEYMYSLLRNSTTRKTLAIDVGANIGNHSIFMRSFLSDYLIAIEPNAKILPFLRRNLSMNINNYAIYDCAVGEANATATLVLPEGAKNNIGMARVSFNGNGNTVQIYPLDSIVDKWQQSRREQCNVSVIKIDVEGMELAVLKGAVKTITKYKPHIFVEAATAEEYRKLNDYLQGLGYRKLSKWAATPVFHFAFDPSLLLILRARRAELFRSIQRIKNRPNPIKYLIRYFTGRDKAALPPFNCGRTKLSRPSSAPTGNSLKP